MWTVKGSVNQANCDGKTLESNAQGYSCKISSSVFEMCISYPANCTHTKEQTPVFKVTERKTLP